MKKAERIKIMVKETGLKKEQVEAVLKVQREILETEIREEEKAKIEGIGTIKLKTRAGRKGRNPQTGEPIVIPECKTIAIKIEKAFKEALNK